MLDGYTVIILIERVGWADLGTSNSCKDKLPHGTAPAGAWRLNGVFMTPGFGTCCGALLGATLGPALEVQCARWVPIFPLLLLLLLLVAEVTPIGGTMQKKNAVFPQYENSIANKKHFSWKKRLCN